MDFWTIEVADGRTLSAQLWRDAHGERLLETALTHGAREWDWVVREWGLLLEVSFPDESDWLRFRATAAIRAALDAAPDPVNGLFLYSGRGGSSAVPAIVRPRPRPASGGASIPLPDSDEFDLPLERGPRHGGFDRGARRSPAEEILG